MARPFAFSNYLNKAHICLFEILLGCFSGQLVLTSHLSRNYSACRGRAGQDLSTSLHGVLAMLRVNTQKVLRGARLPRPPAQPR
jgi:hypothetical protein